MCFRSLLDSPGPTTQRGLLVSGIGVFIRRSLARWGCTISPDEKSSLMGL